MTNNQHGQVPEALIDLIDAYAETRHRCGGIYNAKTEAARKAVIEALSGVKALSAAPAEADSVLEDAALSFTIAHIDYVARYGGRCRDCADESGVCPGSGLPCANPRKAIKHVFDALEYGVKNGFIELPNASRAKPAAALLTETCPGAPNFDGGAAYELAMNIDAAPQQEAQEPVAYVHVPHYTVEGKVRPVVSFEKYQQDYADDIYSTRIPLYAAPQPAPAPLREREAFEAWIKKDGGDLGTFGTPPNMHYRNSAVNNAWVAWKARAALAAQGGKV